MNLDKNITKLIDKIEKKYLSLWGKRDVWTHGRFEELSKDIQQKTNVLLSSSTLKRIFGKKHTDFSFSIATLNALSIFIGYKNYTDFCKNNTSGKRKKIISIIIGIFIIFFLILISFLLWAKNKTDINHEFTFMSSNTFGKLPFSADISYDLSKTSKNYDYYIETIFFKELLPKDIKRYSFVIKIPGITRAYLVCNNIKLDSIDFFVETDSWTAFIKPRDINAGLIRYFPAKDIIDGNSIEISDSLLKAYDFKIKEDHIYYVNVKYNSKIRLDSIDFEAKILLKDIKNTFFCAFLSLTANEGFISVPVVKESYSSQVSLFLPFLVLKGSQNDLSSLSVKSDVPVKLKIQTNDFLCKIFLNDSLCFTHKYDKPLGELYSIHLRLNNCLGKLFDLSLNGNNKPETLFYTK